MMEMDASALKGILRGYDRALWIEEDDLKEALNDPTHGPAFREWAELHLSSDSNLLSRDELAFYESLASSGEADRLVAAQGPDSVETVDDEQLRAAVEELNQSTAAILKQTESLKQHQGALTKLIDGDCKAKDTRSSLAFQRAAKQEAVRAELTTSVEQLAHDVDAKVASLEQQTTSADGSLNKTLDAVLHADDVLLSSLQKLGRELDPEDPEQKQAVEKLRELSMRLIKVTVEAARTRLDRVYLEALHTAQEGSIGASGSPEDLGALQEEVDSLYAEILPVAQMSVEQQYLEPCLKSVSANDGQSLRRTFEALIYISKCLDYLIDRMGLVSASIETFQSHQVATASLLAAAKSELAIPTASPKKRSQAQPASPVRLRANSSSRSEEAPLEALIRLLALSLPEGFPMDSAVASTLGRAEWERTAKAHDVDRNVQDSFEQSTSKHLASSEDAIQLLRDSIMAESSFGEEVKLADPEIESSIAVLAQEVAKVRDKVESLGKMKSNPGKPHKTQQSESQKLFLEKWSN